MAGRPTVRTDDVNRKIEEAAALGCTVEEIAFYAGIHRDTLYSWMKDDEVLSDRIKELREKPIIKARQTIIKALEEPQYASWYLARKVKREFSERVENDVTSNGETLSNLTGSEKTKQIGKKYEEELKQLIKGEE